MTSPMPPLRLVTIDGPAGAGKTTVSRLLAQHLGYRYVDTGALYRGVALAAMAEGIAPDDDAGLDRLCQRIRLELTPTERGLRLMLDGVDVTDELRGREVTRMASAVSARQPVRRFLLNLQRALGKNRGAVFEGRDMGTVVFPDAEVKFFLDAAVEERARRRHAELAESDRPPLATVVAEIQRRDRNDSSRQLAPLKPAPDAMRIDATDLTPREVVARMLAHIDRLP
ncbi:MAG: (d)CMP kinase [Desulfobacterales bacterium]|nr:(d)CMP kinase [Desulfobacteraceae bacterium]MDD3991275.1 (d)CMP kinase [Desulfobacteraceae bacterium]MDY0311335.1 (d)CMP kinase [Desulfobacterales bacterium]